MPERAKFYAAQMRWSNVSAGLEFSPLTADTGVDARRAPRRRLGATEHGLVLQDELERDGYTEGCGIVVIALPRVMRDEEIKAAVARIEVAVRTDAEAIS